VRIDADFERWYRSEYPRLVSSLAMVTGDRDLAHEAASEAFVRALERWPRIRGMGRPGGWTYRVALNVARRRLRRRAIEARLLRHVDVPEPAELDPRDAAVWAAVDRLPDRTRTAVILRYVGDLTEPAIAEAMGVRRGTVATMLRRAKEALGQELGATHRPPGAVGAPPPTAGGSVRRSLEDRDAVRS
jgi:RNA polymerase sigma-70 factor (ECF subfamily)